MLAALATGCFKRETYSQPIGDDPVLLVAITGNKLLSSATHIMNWFDCDDLTGVIKVFTFASAASAASKMAPPNTTVAIRDTVGFAAPYGK